MQAWVNELSHWSFLKKAFGRLLKRGETRVCWLWIHMTGRLWLFFFFALFVFLSVQVNPIIYLHRNYGKWRKGSRGLCCCHFTFEGDSIYFTWCLHSIPKNISWKKNFGKLYFSVCSTYYCVSFPFIFLFCEQNTSWVFCRHMSSC